ncbi:MAG: RAMP superfamily CRISPR-associated protein [Melioribacteraceae bacterium]|nr:RAMP superfamily CRISPR-associated protein [Melioribacteraceae bacterium]
MDKQRLKIKLLSDTMIGSGDGFGAIIDSDVVYDEVGIPYIPARRVKGCLRDSALQVVERLNYAKVELYKKEDIEKIFGKKGSQFSVDIRFDNLFIPDYEKTKAVFNYMIKNKNDDFNIDSIIDSYTNIRRSTEIEDGITKEHSFRTVRVLNKEITFEGEIVFDKLDDKSTHLLALAALNLKRIGSKRTRGLGEIKCFIDNDELNKQAIDSISNYKAGGEN